MKLGGIYISIRAKTDKLERDFGKVKTLTKNLGSSLLNLKHIAVGAFVGWGINRIIKDFEQLSKVQEQAEAGLMAAMKSMERYTKQFRQEIYDTASTLQKMTTMGDENILMGAKFLMTYKEIGNEVMPRVMSVMTDIAALMGGDMRMAANMLGKASMGMTGELRRAGITVESATYKSQGFLGVLREIEAQVKGQAAALRATKSGGLEAFGNVVGDVKEKFGLFTSTIKYNLSSVILPELEKLNEHMEEIKKSGELDKWAKEMARGVLDAVKFMVEGFGLLKESIYAVRWAFGALAEKYYTGQVELITKEIKAFKKEIKELQTGKWYFTKAQELEQIKKYEEHIKELTIKLDKYKISLTAGKAMAEDNAAAVNKTVQQIDNLIERLDDIKAGIGDVADAAVDAGKKITGGLEGASDALYDFDKELEDYWWRAEKYERLIIPPPEKVKKELTDIQKEYDIFLERVQGAFADTFYDIYKNQWEGWEDLLGKMTDLFARTLSEWVAKAAMTKITVAFGAKTVGSGVGAGVGAGAGKVGGGIGWSGGIMAGMALYVANVMIKAHKDAEKKARLTWQAGLGWQEDILGERIAASFDIFSKRCDELANQISESVKKLLEEYGTAIEGLVKNTITITGVNLGKLVKSLEVGGTAHAKSRGLSHIASLWLENFEKGIEGYFKRFLDYTLLPSWELWIEGTFRDETVLADIERFGDAFHEAFDVAGPKGVLELWDMVAGLMEDIERAIHPEHFEGLIFQLKKLNKIYAEQRELAEAIGVSTQLVGEAHRVSVLDLIKEREEGIFTLADFSDRLSDLQDLSVGYSALLGDITESAEDLRAVGVEWWAAWETMIRPELYDPGYVSGVEAYHGSLEAWRQFLFDFYQIEPPPEYLGPATFTDEQWARFNELLGEIPERFIDWFDDWFDPNIMLSSWVDPMQTVLATIEGNITNWGMSLADISLLIETLFGDLETILAETQLEPAVQQLKQELDTIDGLIVSLSLPTLGEDLQQLFTGLDIDLPAEFSQQNITNTLNAIQAYRDQLVEGIFAPIQEIIDRHTLTDYELALKALNKWYNENALVLNTLGLALDDLNYAYDLQLGALQELKKELSSPWDDVIKSIQDQILSLTTSMASPLTAIERMALVATEIAGTGIPTTPEEAGIFQSLYGQYLGLAQEAYQRPSAEYAAIFNQTISDLDNLSTIAEGLKTEYDIQVEQLQVLYNIYGTLQGIGGFRHGIDYVPHAGLYQLHQGERVTPAGKDYPELQINLTVNVNGGDSPGATGRAVREEIEDFFGGSIGRKMIQQTAAGR